MSQRRKKEFFSRPPGGDPRHTTRYNPSQHGKMGVSRPNPFHKEKTTLAASSPMQESTWIWMNGELVRWKDAKVPSNPRVARFLMRQLFLED